jgi:hypothetical protein
MDSDVQVPEQDQAGVGRARVRDVLLAGLAGWDRPRRMRADEFERMQARLCDRLSYMDAQALLGLVDLIQRAAGAAAPGVPRWPDQGVIEAWAVHLCPRPVADRGSYVASLLASEMGRRARDEGWLVELYRRARDYGPPPQTYVVVKLKEAAADARRRIEINRERPERVTDEDRAWQAARDADLAVALLLVAAGEDRARGVAA